MNDLVKPVVDRDIDLPTKPKLGSNQPSKAAAEPTALDATDSHNTFRPDIYKVSEGYMN